MSKEIRPAIMLLLLFTLLTGVVYPFGMTALGTVLFPAQAAGSLITQNGVVVGSALIGQTFSGPQYFHGRPSATTGTDKDGNSVAQPNNAANSMGSNLGPTSRVLMERIKAEAAKLSSENPGQPVPVDLVTTSASGFDPDITPAAALFQTPRVAGARNLDVKEIEALVVQFTKPRMLGIVGEPTVNVLKLNMALDEMTQK